MDQQPTRQLIIHLTKARYLLLFTLTLYGLTGLIFNVQATPLSEFRLPANHQSIYRIEKYASHVGDMKNELLYQNGTINYTSIATATGFAAIFLKANPTETSILNWPEKSISTEPKQSSYQYFQEKKHKKNQQILFNYSKSTKTLINGTYKFKPYTLETQQLTWSRQVIPLLMSNDLQQDPSINSNSYFIADKGHIRKYTYTLETTENIEFGNKQIPVLKFKITKEGSRRMSYVWLSKEHFYLPLKIEQYKDNKLNVRMLLTNFNLI